MEKGRRAGIIMGESNTSKVMGIIIFVIFLATIYFLVDVTYLHGKREENYYNEGITLLREENYEDAVDKFSRAGTFKNADLYESYCNLLIDFPELTKEGTILGLMEFIKQE